MLDKLRPAVLITRGEVHSWRDRLTLAPNSVINCDDITTVERSAIGTLIGFLLDSREQALAEAVASAFALEI